MTHFISVKPRGRILSITMFDKLGREAYEHLVPYIDEAIDEYDVARLLFDLSEYYGREAGAELEDVELKLPHFAKVERVAFIGDKRFEPRMPKFCEPFTSAETKYFYNHQRDAAEEWIHEGVE